MATQLRLRRGNTAQTAVFTGALAEVTVDTDKKTLVVHDGVTAGGFPLAVPSDTVSGVLAYNRANSAFAQANLAYNKANSANVLAQAAYDNSNTKFASSGGTISGDVSVTGNVNPTNDNTNYLGSSAKRWHTIYVGPGSVNIDGITLSNTNGKLEISGATDILFPGMPSTDAISDQANNAFAQANLAYDAANTAVTTGQANVGAGLISVTSSYQANVGAGLIAVTSAYEANVGAGLLTKLDKTGGTVSGDVTLTGNLVVKGTTVSVETSTLTTDDSLIKLAKNNTTDAVDIGFYAPYNSSYTGLVRDSADGNYYLFKDLATDPSGNNVSSGSLTIAGLKANLITEVITLRGLDPLDYANTIKSGAEANTGAALIDAKYYTDTANTNLKNYVDTTTTSGYQANVGAGLISVRNDYEANVGAARIADVASGQANVGAGLISVTNAYQANVGAVNIALSTEITDRQANVGAGLISVTNAYQANTGSALIDAKSYTDTANTNLKNYVDVANTNLKNYVDVLSTTSQANVGAGLISVTNAYQANVGAARIADQSASQANVGAGLISYQTVSQANVGTSLIEAKSYTDTANTNLKNYVDVANTNMKNYVDVANTSLKNYVDTNIVNGIEANVGAGIIATQANVGAGLIANALDSQANIGAGLIIVTTAYQANVGAARIADVASAQANVGAGLISAKTTSEANVGAGLISAKTTSEANVGAGLLSLDTSVTTAYQANVGAGLISVTSAYQANVGAGLISAKTASEANVGVGIVDAKSFTQTVYNSSNTKFNSSGGIISGNVEITGNLIVSGNTTTVSANNLVIKDNMLYMNDGANVASADIGIAGSYVDNGYKHSGIFRDYSDGIWKVFDNYTPEPDASPNIDTSNTSFRIGNFTANVIADIITLRGLDPHDYANTLYSSMQANVGAARIADVASGQANVGAGLISVTSAYQANVGAGLISSKTTSEANVGAGLLSLTTSTTSAYQANVGAGLISAKSTSEANVGAGLISAKSTSEANVGAGLLTKVSKSGDTVTGVLTLTGGDTNNSSLEFSGYNQRGGAGYHGFLKANNTNSPNGAKSFRINSDGGLEIVNSAYSALVFGLSDSGDLSSISSINLGGSYQTTGQVITSTTSQVTLNSFATASYRSVKYLVQMTSGAAHHMIELSLIHDGTTVYLSQYGEVKTGASLGTFDASITTGTLSLLFTPTNAITTAKFVGTYIPV